MTGAVRGDASAFDVEVLLFGPLAEIAAAPKIRVAVPAGATLADVLDAVSRAFPALVPRLRAVAVAKNRAYAPRTAAVLPQDEIALIPPVSGG